MSEFFNRWDVLLCPAMPCPAWTIDSPVDVGPGQIEGVETEDMFSRLQFTFPFNLTGLPAISVPAGFTSGGMPVGVQMVSGRWRDDDAIAAAAALERALPWADRWPPLT
jgi:Asp-tRNA(Asn)/Glu-tRNA(Gln) amidotransferase A subunit family amidase